MKQDDIRRNLIDGAIRVIAREGMDKASTKQIGITTSINEAYIYRCFQNKDDLLAKTFASLDDELVSVVTLHIPIMYAQDVTYKTRCRIFFDRIWEFMLGNRDKCLAFVRYYYSCYFPKYSLTEHKKRFAPIVNVFKDAFRDEADVWMILNHILNVMLDFAVKVFNKEMHEDDNYSEHVFRVIYQSVKQYFRNEEDAS